MPFNVFARAISAARINLNVTRRSHATVYASSTCRPFELAATGAAIVSNPVEGIERWFEPGSELLVVVERRGGDRRVSRAARRSRRRRRSSAARARERALDEHTYAHRARRLLELVGVRATAGGGRVAECARIAIVPALNEEETIAQRHRRDPRVRPGLEIVVVDDGSHDRTAEVARAAGARVLRLPFNLGIGGAVQTGFRYAFENGFDLAVRVDGDGQHDPSQLGAVVEPVLRGETDIAVGSRYLGAAATATARPRRAGSASASSRAIVSLLTRQRITDPTSGFQALNRKAIALFAADYPHDYPEVEALVLLLRHRLRLREVPIAMRPRAAGRSSIRTLSSGLLHGEGAARAVRRLVPPLRRPTGGR